MEIIIFGIMLCAIFLWAYLLVVGAAWLTMRKRYKMNWRFWSPFHYFSDGPNGYFSWLDRNQPDWWYKK
jgi:hypothetical protein